MLIRAISISLKLWRVEEGDKVTTAWAERPGQGKQDKGVSSSLPASDSLRQTSTRTSWGPFSGCLPHGDPLGRALLTFLVNKGHIADGIRLQGGLSQHRQPFRTQRSGSASLAHIVTRPAAVMSHAKRGTARGF
jgi:hypothetical protein